MIRYVTWLGGLALLAATLLDVIAVGSRNSGFAMNGSIELVQVAVLVAGTIALFLSTIDGGHAKVHLLVDRLPAHLRGVALCCNALLTALFFALVLAGSAWIAADLWASHEIGELTGVPWRWLRMFANVGFAAVVIVLVAQAVRKGGK